jgi:MGT family glycosyltransferase
MPKILFATLPFPGCLHPHLAVARALSARNHEVAVYTGASARDRVEQAGFRFFPFHPALDSEFTELVLAPNAIGANWRQPWKLRTPMRRFFIDTIPHQLTDLGALFDEFRPDVIVSDPAILAPALVLHEKRQVPVALLSYVPGCTLPGPDAPPMGLGLPSPRNWHTRLQARLAGKVFALFRRGIRRAASEVRRQNGLGPLTDSVVAYTGRLPLFLVPSSPEFDYGRRDLPASVHYVGPLMWYPPEDPSQSPLRNLPRDQPWVHATEGTIHVQDPLVLRTTAQALGGLPLQVILSTGGNRDPKDLDLGPLSANVKLVSWVDHGELLPRLDVLVCTGGGGAVLGALHAGVPIVAVPTDWDHADTVQRVVEAGAGVRLSRRQCTPQRLREAVNQVRSNPSYRENARRLAGSLRRGGGATGAATLIERLAS